MDLRVPLKLGEINNLSDARFGAGSGASFLGFNFNQQHIQFIDVDKVLEMLPWLAGPQLVGEWDNQSAEEIRNVTEALQLDYIQLNSYNANNIEALKEFNLIQNFILNDATSFAEIEHLMELNKEYVKFFMLSIEDESVQKDFFSNQDSILSLKNLCFNYPVMLNFLFDTQNLQQCLTALEPFAINLKGGMELKPGFKDFDSLSDLIELLEIS